MTNIVSAIYALVPKASFNTSGGEIFWYDNRPQPTEEEIQTKIAELEALEPMRLLRIDRNSRLAYTDHFAFQDRIMSEEIKTYRQALRDLPATAEPMLDEQGNLTNVSWPEVPE